MLFPSKACRVDYHTVTDVLPVIRPESFDEAEKQYPKLICKHLPFLTGQFSSVATVKQDPAWNLCFSTGEISSVGFVGSTRSSLSPSRVRPNPSWVLQSAMWPLNLNLACTIHTCDGQCPGSICDLLDRIAAAAVHIPKSEKWAEIGRLSRPVRTDPIRDEGLLPDCIRTQFPTWKSLTPDKVREGCHCHEQRPRIVRPCKLEKAPDDETRRS